MNEILESKLLRKIRTIVQTQVKNNKVFQDEGLKIARGASTVVIQKVFEPTRLREISMSEGLPIGNLYHDVTQKEDVLSCTEIIPSRT